MDRRKLIAVAAALPVTLPLLPVASYASVNATDAAWAAYQTAKAGYAKHRSRYDAFEASLPTGPVPCMADFQEVEEWRPLSNAWHKERAQFPDNPFDLDDDALYVFCEPITNAERAVLSAQAATLTDVERKLTVVSEWNGYNDIPAEFVDGILADVRSLMGVAS